MDFSWKTSKELSFLLKITLGIKTKRQPDCTRFNWYRNVEIQKPNCPFQYLILLACFSVLSCHYSFWTICFQCYTSNNTRIDIFSSVHISRPCRGHVVIYGNIIMLLFHLGLMWQGGWKERKKGKV